ncbi:unnamed protein product [Leuciscus chuanchicus]
MKRGKLTLIFEGQTQYLLQDGGKQPHWVLVLPLELYGLPAGSISLMCTMRSIYTSLTIPTPLTLSHRPRLADLFRAVHKAPIGSLCSLLRLKQPSFGFHSTPIFSRNASVQSPAVRKKQKPLFICLCIPMHPLQSLRNVCSIRAHRTGDGEYGLTPPCTGHRASAVVSSDDPPWRAHHSGFIRRLTCGSAFDPGLHMIKCMDGAFVEGHLHTHTHAPGHREDREPFLLVIFSSDCGPLTDLSARERVTWSVYQSNSLVGLQSLIALPELKQLTVALIAVSGAGGGSR